MSTYLLKAIDILCDILLEYLQRTLPHLIFGSRKHIKYRKSLIRILGTNLPLPKARRVCFNLATWRQNTLPDENPPITQAPVTQSNPEEQKTIKKLEDDLEQLKKQVAMILENQKKFTPPADLPKIVCSEGSAPPPPPPPLPPLFTPQQQLLFTPKKVRRSENKGKQNGVALDALMTELKSGLPKLKPIERSPGGRPLKPPSLLTDPSDVLTEVLKRRFCAAQYSDDSFDSHSSFTSELQEFK